MRNIVLGLIVAITCLSLTLTGCLGKPDNVEPVKHFDASRYLGTWYEIARLDYAYERGLTQVTANYSLREDGGIKVLNRGYSRKKLEWKESEGKAYFMESKNTGYLKVSFFGPFYSSYIIFYLDDNYQYALVSGSDKSYLWLLARTPSIPGDIKADLIAKATALGFDTSKLVYVEQDGDKH